MTSSTEPLSPEYGYTPFGRRYDEVFADAWQRHAHQPDLDVDSLVQSDRQVIDSLNTQLRDHPDEPVLFTNIGDKSISNNYADFMLVGATPQGRTLDVVCADTAPSLPGFFNCYANMDLTYRIGASVTGVWAHALIDQGLQGNLRPLIGRQTLYAQLTRPIYSPEELRSASAMRRHYQRVAGCFDAYLAQSTLVGTDTINEFVKILTQEDAAPEYEGTLVSRVVIPSTAQVTPVPSNRAAVVEYMIADFERFKEQAAA